MDENKLSRWELETFKYNRLHLRLQKILREVVALRPSRVLEMGCGLGLFRKEILARLPGTDYFGCDISYSAVAAIAHPQVVQVDLTKDPLPFPGIQFDCVSGSGILEYIPDLDVFLNQIRSRLRTGGTLVISYYNMHHFYRRCLLALGGNPNRHPDWRNDLTLRGFEELLVENGYLILKRIPVNICFMHMRTRNYQAPWKSALQERMPESIIHPFAHQMVYVARIQSSQ